MGERFYLTTAIDYSNGDPHIGHAFEKIGADCAARYRRLRGDSVRFLMGMDENSQNVVEVAAQAEITPQEWVDRMADRFLDAWRTLSVQPDDFIRTTEPRHQRAVHELLRRIEQRGHIYRGVYRGYYCTGCEAFKQEKDLVDGRCPEHPTLEVRWVEEPNYFFRLSGFGARLREIYDANSEYVRPRAKFNEVRNVVAGGLQDLSISRARLPWGIPWPGDDTHTVYVWFDALINYLAATGFPEAGFEQWWPADLHVIGPDIVRFHAAVWPAMLLAADLPVPRGIWSHGWVNFSGKRFSKTAGVKVELKDAISRYGADALRYFLLREVPWDGDGDFTWERFDARYEADLANGYGNLASRVLAMTARYRDGVVPTNGEPTALDVVGDQVIAAYGGAMDQFHLHEGAAQIWRLVDRANGFVQESAPWNLAKRGEAAALDRALAALARALLRITVMASPFMPEKTQQAWAALGLDGGIAAAGWGDLQRPTVGGVRVRKPSPLFPKPGT
ncbi:MAG: methionine--tRNA ligase [Gemmatimonadetes bacterium]|nr:methionine--tRNA ligase [Gemmatimonadota bacterium]